MPHIMTLAWMLSRLMLFCGVAVAFSGVALFGWHFIRANARAAQADGTAVAWGGAGAKLGFKILTLGLLLHITGFFLGMLLSSLK